MYRSKIMILALTLCILPATRTQAQPHADLGANGKAGTPTITITKLDMSDKTLNLSYEIRNESAQDIWILVGFEDRDAIAEIFMDKDNRTLLIRAKLDFPRIYTSLENIHGRYVLLPAGQTRMEAITLAIPVYPAYPFGSGRRGERLEYATRLSIEIGYYTGDLPAMIRGIFEQPDTLSPKAKISRDQLIKYYFRGPLQFNRVNETLRQRDEEILIPHTDQNLKAEQVLTTIVERVRIPYEEKYVVYTRPESLDLPPCTRVAIQYQPSALEYFFPYAGQQSLLTASERQYLRSLESTRVDDPQRANAFVNDVNKVPIDDGVVRQTSMAHVVCYQGAKLLSSFDIYNDDSIVTEQRDRYKDPNGFPTLRKLTPQVQPFELRVRCGANLRNLWHRLRLCHKAERKLMKDSPCKNEMVYPAPTDWCSAMVRACKTIRMRDEDIIRAHICPARRETKRHLTNSHYAMNPNCKFDSPADMVLLFETKTGWNQHGGAELFTFDNHDPRGGCVLLNDGTVKFIRSKEELEQLRWK